MLCPVELKKFERIPFTRSFALVRSINAFLASHLFIFVVGALTVFANVFEAELYVYTAFMLCGMYISIFGDDFLPIMPMVVCSYIAPSVVNNPGRFKGSIFYLQNGGIYLFSLFILFVISVFVRLFFDKNLGGRNFLFAPRRFSSGMVALGVAYALSGAFSGRYFEHGGTNILFALLQFLSIFLAYWFFTGAVNWNAAPRNYFAFCGLTVGIVILFEILNIYLTSDVVQGGVIVTDPQKSGIFTGWGNANNIGAMLAMMIPFAFALSRRPKNGWIFCVIGVIMAAGVFFTCSRGSILGALFAIGCSVILISRYTEARTSHLIATLSAVIIAVAIVLIFHTTFFSLFWGLVEKGFNPSSRDEIYVNGWNLFTEYPVFGGGFFPPANSGIYEWSNLESFTSFFPPRWHSTLVQLIASCGAVGFVAYAFHRFQTVKFFIERINTEVIYIGLAILTLLIMSLFDCHMFNVGPVLFYSMALAFAEKVKIKQNK